MGKLSQLISRKYHMEIDEALKIFDEPGRIEPHRIISNNLEDIGYNVENMHSITMGKAALILCKLLQAKCEEARLDGKDSLTLEDIEKTIQFVVVDHPGNMYYKPDDDISDQCIECDRFNEWKLRIEKIEKENNDTNNN